MLSLARVVDTHPESHAVDVVLLDDGRRISGVQVLSGSAGGDFGKSDLAVPASTGYEAKKTGTRDIYGVVAWISEIPVVIGFLFPQVAQCLFSDKERMVYRHASDAYMTIDGKGNAEFYHPSGAFIRLGTSGAHEDLTGKDYDKVWKIAKNTGSKVHIHVEQGGGTASLDIDPAGNIAINHAGNLSVTTGGAATIEVTGDTTLTTPTLTVNGNMVLNGSFNQGTGSNGGTATMQGPVSVVGDLTADGISLVNHDHTKGVGKPT